MVVAMSAVLVAALSMISATALNVPRQTPAASCSCPSTVFVTVTATVIEGVDIPTVTVADANLASIASFTSYVASLDSEYYIEQSEDAPPGNGPYPASTTYIHTIDVPAYLATSVIDGNTIFYKSDSNVPETGSVPWETFTVSVSHAPAVSHANQGQGLNETGSTAAPTTSNNTQPSGSPASSYWVSNEASNTSVIGGVGTNSISAGVLTKTSTTHIATTTADVTGPSGETQAPSNSDYGSPYTNQTSNFDLQPRQTCTLVSAGTYGTWCNNWDGSTTLPYTTWETTTTPGVAESQQSSATSTPSTLSSVVEPAPSSCGETGAFSISFEDLPAFSTNDSSTTETPPIFNPHDHFDWGSNWTYAPPPNVSYLPHDGTHLAEVFPAANAAAASILTDGVSPMGFGAGYRNADDHYWFNAYSAWVGCNNTSSDPTVTCDFVATAWQYDVDRARDVVVSTQHFTEFPCALESGCELQEVQFEASFRNLSTMSFYAVVLGQPVNFFMDSLVLDWYNNTCAAGLARASSRKV